MPFSPPHLDDDEIAEVVDSLKSGWITTGPKCKAFEERFARRLASPAALAVNSCTAALHTALAVAGVGPGDEVITTCMTFCSTVGVIEHVGATPVLVDVEPDTLNLDPAQVAAAVTDRTRVILPVHYGGHPCEMDTLESLAGEHGITLVEDAAHALPARYKDRWIGETDHPVCFSFYATKNLTTAEGGMLTASQDFVDRARVASLHGMSRDAWKRYDKGGSWFYEVVMPGFKLQPARRAGGHGAGAAAEAGPDAGATAGGVGDVQRGVQGSAGAVAHRTGRGGERHAPLPVAGVAGGAGVAERFHRDDEGAEHRDVGAFHPDSFSSVLSGEVWVERRDVPGGGGGVRAGGESADAWGVERGGCGRCGRGGDGVPGWLLRYLP